MTREIKSTLLKEKILYRQMDNGLDVYIFPKPGYNKQFAMYATNYGSNDTKFVVPGEAQATTVPDGIAHFLEHKLFEEEDGNVFESYAKLGAQPNAFTNFNMTAYHFTSTDNFYECLDILTGFVGRPYFTDQNVEKEKGIIAQEIKMYEDDPNWRVFFNLLGGMYQNHPVRNDIAGTVDSIMQIDKELLYKCYNTFYHPSNMVLFIIGDIDPDRVWNQLESKFNKDNRSKQGKIDRIYPDEPENVTRNRIEEKLAVSRPLFALGFKDKPVGEGGKLLERIVLSELVIDMLAGPSSDLYTRLYEEGLIDGSFGADYTAERDYCYAMMTGETSNPDKVVDTIFDGIRSIREKPFERAYFERIKKKKLGEFIRNFNYIEVIGYIFSSLIFKDIMIFDYLQKLNDVSYDQVIDAFNNLFDINRSTVSIIKP